MAGDGLADGIAAILFEVYGRGRVSPRLWPRLMRLARGDDVTESRSVLEAARAFRSELLAAEHGLRLLVALVDCVGEPAALSGAERRELATIVGVGDDELRLYYLDSDLVTVHELLGMGPAGADTPAESQPRPSGTGGAERHRDVAETSARGGTGETTALGWWASLAALESWVEQCPSELPDRSSEQTPEALLGQWLSHQVDLLVSGDLVEPRRSELLRLLSSVGRGAGGDPYHRGPAP